MVSAVQPRSITPTIDIYIRLANYPVMADRIRARMRQELYDRSIVDEETFEAQVYQKALESQRRERLTDPFGQEEAHTWQRRLARVRDFQTDAYFANTFGNMLLDQIIAELLHKQPYPSISAGLTFNPEIAPWEVLFRQGEIYEQLPETERERSQHHLEEIKVVLIKRLISDQLPYIGIAKQIFTISDLRYIYSRRIGGGKVGGKSAGVMLASRILQRELGAYSDSHSSVVAPESYFIGTEVIYEFRLMNSLDHFMNQKYRPVNEIQDEYPHIVEAHLAGKFPREIVAQLRAVLENMGDRPVIVRSSSLLEDNFGYAFAGKYNSYFCPNQGSTDENLSQLLDAVRLVYASTLNPDAILYRQQHGLIDYDERMAILIQEAVGEHYGHYYFPALAGVGFSQNPFRWNEQIRREDGFLRIVCGFGTRAVDRVSNDYPRLIALSHPLLRPETTARAIRQYSQWYIDVIDVNENEFVTLPVVDVLDNRYPYLRYIASIDRGDYLQDILSAGSVQQSDELVLTLNGLTKDRQFIALMRMALQRLEAVYQRPVDVEFAIGIKPGGAQTAYRLHLLQCRPLSQRAEDRQVRIPKNIPDDAILFRSTHLVPDGRAEDIRYIIYVDPKAYYRIESPTVKQELGRAISRLNERLQQEQFILMGPGRWGSVNIDLGVRVSYGDIFNTRVLIEMAVSRDGSMPELSYGTHFFQDLVEAGIHSLPLHLGAGADADTFNWNFFETARNHLAEILPADAALAPYLKVIDLDALPGHPRLNVLMNGARDEAVGFLKKTD